MKVPVLFPKIFDHPFTYDSNSLILDKGHYVTVPFGATKITGVVLTAAAIFSSASCAF